MHLSRRRILALPAASALGAAASPASLNISITDHRVVTKDGVREPQLYKLRSGHLLLTFHTQPDLHFARRAAMRSTVFINRVASTAYPTPDHFPPDDHPIRKFYQ